MADKRSKKINEATYDSKINYLKVVMEVTLNRRDSLENKSSILLASNAIILSAVIGFGLPSFNGINSLSVLNWIQLVLLVGTLLSIVISVLSATNILSPLNSFKKRSKILEINKNEHNLFFFGKIAEMSKSNFNQEIGNLTNEEILLQYTAEIHNSSKIILKRYNLLSFSHKSFVISIILFTLLSLTKLIS